MGYGAPHAAVPPRTRPVSPSRAPGFRRRLRGSKPPYASGYSPRLTGTPSPLLPQVRGPGREVPPLGRGTCHFPPSLRPGRLRGPFPLRGSGARGTPGTARTSRTPGGRLGAGRGSHPPRYRPSCRAPPVVPGQRGLQSPSAPWCLAAPSAPACSAHVMGLWVHPIPWVGLSPTFPRSALGVRPQDPFRVAQPSPPIPRGMWIAVEPEAVPPERRVECGASQDFPPAPRFPGVRHRSGSS
ncbi:hypothetical protein A0O31_02575 (plasmid) [Thermus brockianus]|uniref:Uncharacterized protein n=1 Tax=Thermus brockianus TaxID=56956 RepID=A0A1J0LYS5_THEBO|nr:hypothetical protein A0O31_02575 [Thermus brockianus]